MQDQKPKSLFALMRPKLDVELADRLIRQVEEARQAKAAQAEEARRASANTGPVLASAPVKKAKAPGVPPVPMEPFVVTLELELVDDPEKSAPCWGYIRPAVLGIALNRAFEPTRSALLARDLPVLKWLVMLGLVTRMICQHRREPRLKFITKHLWKMVERPTDTFWDSPGVAFRMAQHPISAGLEKINWDSTEPQTFGSFVVEQK